MILDLLGNLPESALKELKERHPEKNEHFVKSMIALTDIGTRMLQESPEFRQAFARIHLEFLKYPESKTLLKKAAELYNEEAKS